MLNSGGESLMLALPPDGASARNESEASECKRIDADGIRRG